MRITIQQPDFDLAAELAVLRASSTQVGAVVSFVGLVRDFSEQGEIENLYLEHYPGMSENVLIQIINQAAMRWHLLDACIIHRIGTLLPNDQIVLVATAAAHRAEAFAACEFIIDYLKTDAPFWKREQTSQGSCWLETRHSDKQRTEHWLKMTQQGKV